MEGPEPFRECGAVPVLFGVKQYARADRARACHTQRRAYSRTPSSAFQP